MSRPPRSLSSWKIATAMLVVLLLAGCRQGPTLNRHIESVNAENRQLEDEVYILQGEKEELEAELAHITQEYERLKSGRGPTNRGPLGGLLKGNDSGSSVPQKEGDGQLTPPTVDEGDDSSGEMSPEQPQLKNPVEPKKFPPSSSTVPGAPKWSPNPSTKLSPKALTLTPPAVEAMPPDDPSLPVKPQTGTGDTPTPAKPNERLRPLELPPQKQPEDVLPAPPARKTFPVTPEIIDRKVTHLFLNPLLTRGANLDQEPGDDGLSVLIEPRNQADEFVPLTGQVSIVVLDPAGEGDAARIARWDFDATAVEQKLSQDPAHRGIHLQMPWPGQGPELDKVQVYVRWTAADGRQLRADREVFLTKPGQVPQRWSTRTRNRTTQAAPTSETR